MNGVWDGGKFRRLTEQHRSTALVAERHQFKDSQCFQPHFLAALASLGRRTGPELAAKQILASSTITKLARLRDSAR